MIQMRTGIQVILELHLMMTFKEMMMKVMMSGGSQRIKKENSLL